MSNHVLHEKVHFESIRDLLANAEKSYADRTAYSFRENPRDKEIKSVTFGAFIHDVHALASKLRAAGFSGKQVVLVGKFSYDWALSYFATLSIGATLVPLDRDWTVQDLCDTAKRAEASFLLCDEDLADKAQAIEQALSLDTPCVYLCAKEQTNSLRAWTEEGRALYAENPALYDDAEVDPKKMALLVFTSGTTGKGKGVMLSQYAVVSDMHNVVHFIDFSQKTVGVLPPHHTYGSTVMLVGHMTIGSEIYISSGIRYVQKELKEQKPGHMVLVPLYLETFYRKIMANIKEQGKEKLIARMIKLCNFFHLGKGIRKKMFSAIHAAFGGEVKVIITGGAPINPDIMHFFTSIGIDILNGYGITECAPLIAVNRSAYNVLGSVGLPIDEVEIKIDSPNEDGEGEIWAKGPNVMLGYFGDEATTAEALEDGYFKTGDYGKIGAGGALFITGRKKNLIILSNGKNVYPEEIENELIATPGILEIIVYEGQSKRGISHNAIVAEIFPDRDYMDKNGITDFEGYLKPFIDDYNRNAVPYKKITVVKVRSEEFPKNTLRKILRFKLDMTID